MRLSRVEMAVRKRKIRPTLLNSPQAMQMIHTPKPNIFRESSRNGTNHYQRCWSVRSSLVQLLSVVWQTRSREQQRQLENNIASCIRCGRDSWNNEVRWSRTGDEADRASEKRSSLLMLSLFTEPPCIFIIESIK